MNGRIKELMSQTALHRNDHTTEQRLAEVEKFAVLIIKKCRDIVSDTRDQAIEDDWITGEAMSTAMFDIEDHFGV